MPTEFTVRVDGREVIASERTTVSSAIASAGFAASRVSVSAQDRGPLCAMGICFECRVTVDGVPHARGCQVLCRPGMDIRTRDTQPTSAKTGQTWSTNDLAFDVLVIGGGPAGLAAATAAAESGAKVGIVDDNPAFGGQIWRGAESAPARQMAPWYAVLRKENVKPIRGARVFEQPEPGVLFAESADEIQEFRYGKLILATGARERFLPFPGWTLPNVMGAGGLQAMAKSGAPIAGKRVVVAGSGPLLLAVAAYLKDHGARVLAIVEQAKAADVRRFAASLLFRFPGKIAQAAALRLQLTGIPYRTDSWPVEAKGDTELRSVVVRTANGRTDEIACDYLACGFGLVPNTELPALLGCELRNGFVAVNDMQQAAGANIYCAGEPTGIGGLELSLVEGQIAGYAATGNVAAAQSLFSQRTSYRSFAHLLEHTFRLRDELKALPTDSTFVCRCEDVTFARVRQYPGRRAAKLQTRCGMGPCQGRVCGPAVEFILGWKPESVRPPVFPARVASLAHAAQTHHQSEEHL